MTKPLALFVIPSGVTLLIVMSALYFVPEIRSTLPAILILLFTMAISTGSVVGLLLSQGSLAGVWWPALLGATGLLFIMRNSLTMVFDTSSLTILIAFIAALGISAMTAVLSSQASRRPTTRTSPNPGKAVVQQ